jgi:hypothetical protein
MATSIVITINIIKGKAKFIMFNSTLIGLTMEETPIIHRTFRISAPIIFPTAISPSPLSAAVTQQLISGREVPMAMTVNPIIALEIEKYSAMLIDAQMTARQVRVIPIIPTANRKIGFFNKARFEAGEFSSFSPKPSLSLSSFPTLYLCFRRMKIK